MKLKLFALALTVAAAFALAACGKKETAASSEAVPASSTVEAVPESILSETEMLDICELATLDCYYHNVVKVNDEDNKSILPWVKYDHYWIEYSGIVTLGVDVSKVDISVDGTQVEITMPEAEILDYSVDESTFEDSGEYIVLAKDSAKIDADDEKSAFTKAESDMREKAQADTKNLERARQRAEELLENYIKNFGEATGKSYTVEFKTISSASDTASQASSAT